MSVLHEARRPAASPARENALLAALGFEDRALLSPYLRRTAVAAGQTLARADETLETVFLPETMLACCHERLGGGRLVGAGLIGAEGLIGWPVLLGSARERHDVTAELGGGTALALPVRVLVEACRQSASLRELMLRYVHSFTAQMARTLVSTLDDPVERRVARWLVMLHDRVPGDTLDLTHERLGDTLNIRRASVTGVLHLLEGAGLVRCARSRITVRDRAGLQASAGGCYGAAEADYRAQIGAFGKG